MTNGLTRARYIERACSWARVDIRQQRRCYHSARRFRADRPRTASATHRTSPLHTPGERRARPRETGTLGRWEALAESLAALVGIQEPLLGQRELRESRARRHSSLASSSSTVLRIGSRSSEIAKATRS